MMKHELGQVNMAVQAVSTSNFPKQSSNEFKGPWAILGVLSLIRNTLSEGQIKMSESTQKLTENNNKIQDKRSKELKQLVKLSIEALKEETESNLIRDITLGFIVAAMVGGPIVAAVASKSIGALALAGQFMTPVCSLIAGGLQIKAEMMTIKTSNKRLKIAEIDEHNNVDAGLTQSNGDMVSFAGDTLASTVKVQASLQEILTRIIGSIGSAINKGR